MLAEPYTARQQPEESNPHFMMKRLRLSAKNNKLVKLVFKTPWIGMYRTFAEALADIPAQARIGYNQQEMSDVYRTLPIDTVRAADYPVMLHLRALLKPGDRVADLGGSIGMMCYTTQKYFPLPDDVEWVVCDVPKMVEASLAVAKRESGKSGPLRFVTSLAEIGSASIFFSSGALQFIEKPLPALLQELPVLPAALLVNRIPAWDYKRSLRSTTSGSVSRPTRYSIAAHSLLRSRRSATRLSTVGAARKAHSPSASGRRYGCTRTPAFYFSLTHPVSTGADASGDSGK